MYVYGYYCLVHNEWAAKCGCPETNENVEALIRKGEVIRCLEELIHKLKGDTR